MSVDTATVASIYIRLYGADTVERDLAKVGGAMKAASDSTGKSVVSTNNSTTATDRHHKSLVKAADATASFMQRVGEVSALIAGGFVVSAADMQNRLFGLQAQTGMTNQELGKSKTVLVDLLDATSAQLPDMIAGLESTYAGLGRDFPNAAARTREALKLLAIDVEGAIGTNSSVATFAGGMEQLFRSFPDVLQAPKRALNEVIRAAQASGETVQEFISNLGKAPAVAAGFKIPFTETLAIVSELTQTLGSGAGQGFVMTMSRLLQDAKSSKLLEELRLAGKGSLSQGIVQFASGQIGLNQIVGLLSSAHLSRYWSGAVFGGSRSAAGIMSLLGDSHHLSKLRSSIGAAGDPAAALFNKAEGKLTNQLEMLKNTFFAFSSAMGSVILPQLLAALRDLTPPLRSFASLLEHHKKAVRMVLEGMLAVGAAGLAYKAGKGIFGWLGDIKGLFGGKNMVVNAATVIVNGGVTPTGGGGLLSDVKSGAMWTAGGAGIIGILQRLVGRGVGGAADLFGGAVSKFPSLARLVPMLEGLAKVIPGIGLAVSALSVGFAGKRDFITGGLNSAFWRFDSMFKKGGIGTKWIDGSLGHLKEDLGAIGFNAGHWFAKRLYDGWSGIGAAAYNLGHALRDKLSGGIGDLVNFGSWFIHQLGRGITEASGFVNDAISGVVSAANTTLMSLVNSGKDLGVSLVQRIGAGISGAAGSVKSKVGDLVSSIGGWFPHSPPRFGEDQYLWGWNLVDRIMLGFRARQAALLGVSANLMASLASTATSPQAVASMWRPLMGGVLGNLRALPAPLRIAISSDIQKLEQQLSLFRTRYVDAVNLANTRYFQGLRSENTSYTDRLGNLLKTHAISLTAYAASQGLRMQTILTNSAQVMRNYLAQHREKLSVQDAQYLTRLELIRQRESMLTGPAALLAVHDLSQQIASFERSHGVSLSEQAALMQIFLSNAKRVLGNHVSELRKAFTEYLSRQRAAEAEQIRTLKEAHNLALSRLRNEHHDLLTRLANAFNVHVLGIESALKPLADPGQLWTTLQSKMTALLQQSQGAVALMLYEGKRVTAAQLAQSSLVQNASYRMGLAMDHASYLIALRSNDASAAMSALSKLTGDALTKAQDSYALALMNGSGHLGRLALAIQHATWASNRLAGAQAVAAAIAQSVTNGLSGLDSVIQRDATRTLLNFVDNIAKYQGGGLVHATYNVGTVSYQQSTLSHHKKMEQKADKQQRTLDAIATRVNSLERIDRRMGRVDANTATTAAGVRSLLGLEQDVVAGMGGGNFKSAHAQAAST